MRLALGKLKTFVYLLIASVLFLAASYAFALQTFPAFLHGKGEELFSWIPHPRNHL